MAKRTKDLAESVDQGGQYHGVEENSNKDADRLVLNVINNDLDIDLTDVAIDYIHRAGDPKKKRKKAYPITAKFVRYYDQKEVFSKEKHLKGKDISTTESLTRLMVKKLEEAREKYGFNYVWTIKNGNDKPGVYYG